MGNCGTSGSALYRATTPRHKFSFPSDINSYKKVLVTYGQRGKIRFVKTKEDFDISVDDPKVGTLTLSEEDTNKLDGTSYVEIEVRVCEENGNVPPRASFKIASIGVINDEVLGG